MEKKYYVRELLQIEDFDFSNRLKFFISKSGDTTKQFYEKCYKKWELPERTFKSYLLHGRVKSARRPKKKMIEGMAELLNIPSMLLLWGADEFEENFNKYLDDYRKKWGVNLLTIDIESEASLDVDVLSGYNTKEENFCRVKEMLDVFYPMDDKSNELYYFLNYLDRLMRDRGKKVYINEKINKMLILFEELNDKGKDKLIKYGNIIVDSVMEEKSGSLILPRNSNELVNMISFTWGKFESGFMKYYDYFLNVVEDIVDLELKDYQWNIFLLCMCLDSKNNTFFPDDALESFILIAQLFVLDEEFSE